MKVIFTTTTKSKLATLPVTNGQIIALSDAVGYYYDMAGIRYPASSTQVLDSLPATGIVDMLYIVNNAVYTWDGIEFVKLISSIEIDDSTASTVSTYSSSKIEDLVSESLADVIDDTTASTSTAYSSQKTEELIEAVIDDSSASTATAYSSQKTDEQIAAIIDDSTSSTATAYSGAKVDTLIQGVTSFEVEIVQALPTEDIDTHTIYFLEKSTPGQQNYYEEYMYIENTWELIGTTEVTISIATTATAGIVKPDGTTISVAADGTITAIGGGGSSGHTIMNDAGSTLSAEDNLQFKGAYVEDDSANDKTIVNVVRDMNYADVASLTAAQKKGIIITEKDRLPSGTVINATNTGYNNIASGLTATNVQDAIDELADGGGTGGGHVIENQTGTAMTQRANMQFLDASLTDDSTNDVTQIEVVKQVASAAAIASLPDGIYQTPEEDEYLEPVAADVTYNNTTSGLTATDVQAAIDELKSLIPAGRQYITTGLVTDANAIINDGGYCIENGFVYVDITVTARANYTIVGSALVAGFPTSTASGAGAITPVFNQLRIGVSSSLQVRLEAGATISNGQTLHFIGSYQMQ